MNRWAGWIPMRRGEVVVECEGFGQSSAIAWHTSQPYQPCLLPKSKIFEKFVSGFVA